MHQCPECGHRWHDEARASGGKARWEGVSERKRSEAARAASLAMGKRARAKSNSAAAKSRWERFRAERFDAFIGGLGAALGVERPDAVHAWDCYAKNLLEYKARKLIAGGQESGLVVGRVILFDREAGKGALQGIRHDAHRDPAS